MRARTAFLLLVGALATVTTASGEVSVTGFVAGRAVGVESQPSWLQDGLGRLRVGADGSDDSREHGLGMAHFALDVSTPRFGVYVQGVARTEPGAENAEAAGLVEAYIEGRFQLRQADRLRFRLGQFFLPTSRENVEMLWSSPYTLTYSAINSWIAEEVRPVGLGVEYDLALGQIDSLRVGGSVFTGNDTSGALLAWRGWSLHDRLSVYDEVLPLPPLAVLQPGGAFSLQRDAGSKPFGSDLDDELGWAAYVRYKRPERLVLQWTRYDNRADRGLHGGPGTWEYAWETYFDLFGLEANFGPRLVVLGELIEGETGMGLYPGPRVQADFESAYVLASYQAGAFRVSLRYDTFETVDRDPSGGSQPNEDGDAVTLAFIWEATESLRLGVEAIDVSGERSGAYKSGLDPDLDATGVSVELRYYFDF